MTAARDSVEIGGANLPVVCLLVLLAVSQAVLAPADLLVGFKAVLAPAGLLVVFKAVSQAAPSQGELSCLGQAWDSS